MVNDPIITGDSILAQINDELNELDRKQINELPESSEKRLQEAISIVESVDWSGMVLDSISGTQQYVMIPPSCHLVENCCIRFRQYLKDRGLYFLKQKISDVDSGKKPLNKKGGYYMCVATSLQLAKLKIAEEIQLNLKDDMLLLSTNSSSNEIEPNLEKAEISKKRKLDDSKPAKEKKSRAPSAFLLFSNDIRRKIAADNPSAAFGDLSRLLGHAWSTLDNGSKDVSKYNSKFINI